MFPLQRRRNPRQNVRRKQPKPRGMKSINAVVPFRVSGNKQIFAIPQHNHQLRLHRTFRFIAPITLLTGAFTVTISDIITAVRAELGIVADNTIGEVFAVHSAKCYSPDVVTNEFSLRVFDIEEATAAGTPNLVANFNADSAAAVSYISLIHPVNNRPTFNRSTASTTLYAGDVGPITGVFTFGMIFDLVMTYVRTPSNPFLTKKVVPTVDAITSDFTGLELSSSEEC